MTDEDQKKKMVIEAIEKSELSEEAKKVGMAGALMGQASDMLIGGMMAAANANAEREAEKAAPKQRPFAGYTPVERQVAKMLTENTGVHMMDSGGTYGRAWQRNREVVDFRTRPEVSLEMYIEDKVRQTERVQFVRPQFQKTIAETTRMQQPRVTLQIVKRAPRLSIPQKQPAAKEPMKKLKLPKKEEKAAAPIEVEEEKERLKA